MPDAIPVAIPVAIIGLDTSHAVEYPRRMQAPNCPPELRVAGLRAVSCLRFPSPFQNEAGQVTRQAQLAAWGVRAATNLDDAVRGAAAIMLEINDPSQHLHWFEQVATLGLPIFIDKPLADNVVAGTELVRLAQQHGTRVASCSPLRSDAALQRACCEMPQPNQTWVYGPLVQAPTGSSIVWYGVHCFEMLQRAMGSGAVAVTARRDETSVVAIVDYNHQRRGLVELTCGVSNYGGTLRNASGANPFTTDGEQMYSALLREIEHFMRGGKAPANLDDALEVLAMLDATERSTTSGRCEPVYH